MSMQSTIQVILKVLTIGERVLEFVLGLTPNTSDDTP